MFPLRKIMDYPEDSLDDNMVNFEHQLENAQKRNIEYALAIEELSIERDYLKSESLAIKATVREREEELLRTVDDGMREKECLEVEIYEGMREREELVRRIDVGMREKERLLKEIEVFKERNEELEKNLTMGLGFLGSIKETLMRVNKGLDGKLEIGMYLSSFEGKFEEWKEMRKFLGGLEFVANTSKRIEEKLSDYQEEIEAHKLRNEELQDSFSKGLVTLGSLKVSLMRACLALNEKEGENGILHEYEESLKQVLNLEEKSQEPNQVKFFPSAIDFVLKIARRVEEKLKCYQEKVIKEKRELENSVVSLTEENRDVNTLLRIALVEKEAMEKKLKGNNEQKSFALLQLFGFMMGGAANEQSELQKKDDEQISENMTSNVKTVSEEEVVSLASTVEKMMKGLRLEITQLRRALAESRTDTECLQSLTERQAKQITEQEVYIKELEDRERILSENVEQLLIEIKATEEDVERWREACELEVEAGKHVVEERDKVIAIQKEELEKTRAALKASNKKLKMKEELAGAAMAAQSAAERSLQLADTRVAGLHQRIQELTMQLEESEIREKTRIRKKRRICWPWQAFKFANPANVARTRVRSTNIQHVLPEMQALLH